MFYALDGWLMLVDCPMSELWVGTARLGGFVGGAMWV